MLITQQQTGNVSKGNDQEEQALVRYLDKVDSLLAHVSSLFTCHSGVEPVLISHQVVSWLVFLGLTLSASACKYMGLQEAGAHLHGPTIGQQTALPEGKK